MNTVKDINDVMLQFAERFNDGILPHIQNAKSQGELRRASRTAVAFIKQTEYRLKRMVFDKDLEVPLGMLTSYLSTSRKAFEQIAKGNPYKGAEHERQAKLIYAEYLRRYF
ncbi:hypothetical protein ACUUYQ_03665 [Bacillus halotolerans]|uniref:hypothetical protein n=1 Tax=Bacillus subtilis group TaxID=653685 RepID=UPI0028F70515|nr:hypothetical protein [Bacillus atrophaeus]WNV81144.1 hypothetical protein RUL31_07690 [Bacillus atrophaeus]